MIRSSLVAGVWTALLLSGCVGLPRAGAAEAETPQPWDLPALQTAPKFRWLDAKSPIRSLVYQGQKFQGRDTEVFAFYATPGTISGDPTKDKNLPAVVLLHGGGGTAFDEWVWLWARRGYAAISMDMSGRRPPEPKFDAQTGELIVGSQDRKLRKRLSLGGPEADHVAKFTNVGGDLTDDWQYHAVAAAMRAHSLVRSFPEVDKNRTGVTGISWGGYLTCLVASIDDRFKAAVPVYGCGFLYDGESVQRPLIEQLEDAKQRLWIEQYEPSVWLPHCKVPTLFVNGTNDPHYPLVSYARSYQLVKGPRQLRIEAGMHHSHNHGWAPEEIGLFMDQHLKEGDPLPWLSAPRVVDGKASVVCESKRPLKAARLHYTRDTGPLIDRQWQHMPATIDQQTIHAAIPPGATIWLFGVTDDRDAMVSTEVVFAE
jgi:dienelactone hydrolase